MARPQAQETEKVEPTASLLTRIPFTTLRAAQNLRKRDTPPSSLEGHTGKGSRAPNRGLCSSFKRLFLLIRIHPTVQGPTANIFPETAHSC